MNCPKCDYPEMFVISWDWSIQRLGTGCEVMCAKCQHRARARIVLVDD